jgi:hypothetical protein
MSDDLIKRDDALATIDTFKRNFEQPWKVQFSADIRALPAVDLSERIEQLNERLTAATDDAKEAEAYAEQLEAKLTKAVETLQKISRHANRSCSAIAARALDELEKMK